MIVAPLFGFDKALKIQLEPGIIGSQANAILAEFDRKIGPDPASIDSAKIKNTTGYSLNALIDRAGLRSVEDKPGMPAYLRELEGTVTALLVETRTESVPTLMAQISQIREAIQDLRDWPVPARRDALPVDSLSGG